MMIALAVFVGLKQVSRGTFKRSSSSVNRGQKKKLFNNKTKPTGCFDSPAIGTSLVPDADVVPTKMPGQNITGSSLQWVSSPSTLQDGDISAFGQLESTTNCSYPLPMPCELNCSSGLYVNSTVDTAILSAIEPQSEPSQGCALNTVCGVFQYGSNLIHLTSFLGLLLMILLVYLGTCLAILAIKLFHTQVNNMIEVCIFFSIPGILILITYPFSSRLSITIRTNN